VRRELNEVTWINGLDNGDIHVFGPRVTVVQQRTKCASMKGDAADFEP
jgi:hypothetical protein